ncbi:MAG: hypothetical protein ACEQSR_08570 [Candidatus Methylacidiphilales bacterium]
MDLTKFYPTSLNKLPIEDLAAFQSLTIEQIAELSKQDAQRQVPYLVYKNNSNNKNPYQVLGTYTRVLEYMQSGSKIELVSPRHMFNPSQQKATVKKEVPVVVIEKSISLEEFAALKASEAVATVEIDGEKVEVPVSEIDLVVESTKIVEVPKKVNNIKNKKK